PVRRMKIALFAVLRRETPLGDAVAPYRSFGLATSTKYDATMPVPAIFRKRRREKPGPSGRPPPRLQVSHASSSLIFIGVLTNAGRASARQAGRKPALRLLSKREIRVD